MSPAEPSSNASRSPPRSSATAYCPRAGWMHLAGPVENGWRVVNVVPSRQESENFAREQLLPALRPQRTRRLRRGSSFALAAWSRFKEVRPNTPIRTKVGLPNRARDHHHLSQRLHQPDLSAEALDPEVIRRYQCVATGEKYLLSPIRTDPADRCQNDKGASLRQSERVACRRSAT